MIFRSKFLNKTAKLPQHHSSTFKDLKVVIEWPKGTFRTGEDGDGNKWRREMKADYGYIPNTTAAGDQENLDVYIGSDPDSDKVFVVEQLKEDGSFDEYKCLLGFPDIDSAYNTYLEHYPDGWDEDRVGDVEEVPFDYAFETIEKHQQEQTS